jgi:hypothetical protein
MPMSPGTMAPVADFGELRHRRGSGEAPQLPLFPAARSILTFSAMAGGAST